MTNAVKRLYAVLDVSGLVAPCHLKPQFGNPQAKLSEDLHIADDRRSHLREEIQSRLGVELRLAVVHRAVTVDDLAKLIPNPPTMSVE